MNKTQKRAWFRPAMILLSLALVIYVAVEMVVLRRVPAVFGRFAPLLTFWSNIVLGLALGPDDSIPIWISSMLNLSLLFIVVLIHKAAVVVQCSRLRKGKRS
jgi:hypothetical protein